MRYISCFYPALKNLHQEQRIEPVVKTADKNKRPHGRWFCQAGLLALLAPPVRIVLGVPAQSEIDLLNNIPGA